MSNRIADSAWGPLGAEATYRPFEGTPGTGMSPVTGSGCHQYAARGVPLLAAVAMVKPPSAKQATTPARAAPNLRARVTRLIFLRLSRFFLLRLAHPRWACRRRRA